MTTGQVLADQIRRTREWTLKLLADLQGHEWTFQPRTGLQHPLWIAGHLACSQELLLFQRCLKRSVLNPQFLAHFPVGGDIKSASEYPWPDLAAIRGEMDHMQQTTEETVASLTDELLAEPAFAGDGSRHPHYDTKLGAISHLARHEAFHAGQLAMLRRLLGKRFLR